MENKANESANFLRTMWNYTMDNHPETTVQTQAPSNTMDAGRAPQIYNINGLPENAQCEKS